MYCVNSDPKKRATGPPFRHAPGFNAVCAAVQAIFGPNLEELCPVADLGAYAARSRTFSQRVEQNWVPACTGGQDMRGGWSPSLDRTTEVGAIFVGGRGLLTQAG